MLTARHSDSTTPTVVERPAALERHYGVAEVAKLWGFSETKIREWFRDEPGVLQSQLRTLRPRKHALYNIRIPESVLRRAHGRLSREDAAKGSEVRTAMVLERNGGMSRSAPRLYRRHVKQCFGVRRCLCPIWIDFSVSPFNRTRKSLGTRDMAIAMERSEAEFAIRFLGPHAPIDEILVAKAILAVNECRSLEGPLVYLVGTRGSLKIGATSDVANRIANLQIGCASKLMLRRVFRGGFGLERTLHDAFSQFSRLGEWFSVNSTLSAFIDRSERFSVTLDEGTEKRDLC